VTAVTDRRKDSARRRSSVAFGTSRPRPPLRSSDQPGRDEGTVPLVEARKGFGRAGWPVVCWPERCCHGRANRQRPGAPTRRWSRRVDPLAQAGLDEPLGPTVGVRGVGFGAHVAQPKGAASLPPMVAAISRAVIDNDALDGDTVAGNSGERAFEKRRFPCARRAESHYRLGEASSIQTWTHSQPVPRLRSRWPQFGQAFRHRMDQLAWPLARVAHHRRLGFECRQVTEHQAAQNLPYRRNGMPSCRAIAGPLRRCRRRPSISAIRSAEVRFLRCWGAELRSASAAAPPQR
jgi:hypothetical protein